MPSSTYYYHHFIDGVQLNLLLQCLACVFDSKYQTDGAQDIVSRTNRYPSLTQPAMDFIENCDNANMIHSAQTHTPGVPERHCVTSFCHQYSEKGLVITFLLLFILWDSNGFIDEWTGVDSWQLAWPKSLCKKFSNTYTL